MAVLKIVKQKAGNYAKINVIVNYLMKDNRHDDIECYNFTAYEIEDVVESFKLTQQHFNKYGTGRQYVHMVIGFDDVDKDKLDNEMIFKVTSEFLKSDKFKEHESFAVIHRDTDNVHAHLVINAVNYINGKKYKQDSKELYVYKKNLNDICNKYGLSTIKTHNDYDTMNFHYDNNKVFNMKNYNVVGNLNNSIQYNIKKRDGNSWTERIATVVQDIRNKSVCYNLEDFKNELLKYNIELNYDNKYMVFKDLEYEKVNSSKCKIRDRRLNKLYNINISKEILMEEFEINEKNRCYNVSKEREYDIFNGRTIQQLSSEHQQLTGREHKLEDRERKIEDSIEFDRLFRTFFRRKREVNRAKEEGERGKREVNSVKDEETRRRQEDNGRRKETSFIDFDKLFKSDRANGNNYNNKRKDDIDIGF